MALDYDFWQQFRTGVAGGMEKIRASDELQRRREALLAQTVMRDELRNRAQAQRDEMREGRADARAARQNLYTAARLPGAAGRMAQKQLYPSLTEGQLMEGAQEALFPTLLKEGQYDAANPILTARGLPPVKKTGRQMAEEAAMAALTEARRAQAKAIKDRTTVYIGDVAARNKRLDAAMKQRAANPPKTATELGQLQDVYSQELEGLQKQYVDLKNQPGYYKIDDEGNYLDIDGNPTLNPEAAAVDENMEVQERALLERMTELNRRLKGLGDVANEYAVKKYGGMVPKQGHGQMGPVVEPGRGLNQPVAQQDNSGTISTPDGLKWRYDQKTNRYVQVR